jgi:hypothetical protein
VGQGSGKYRLTFEFEFVRCFGEVLWHRLSKLRVASNHAKISSSGVSKNADQEAVEKEYRNSSRATFQEEDLAVIVESCLGSRKS